ncbi:MAG: hypothetical protein ACRELX_05985 [Longimicrobiales bacterium]
MLLSLLLSFAEGAFASTCDPSMPEMGVSTTVAMPGMDDMRTDHDCSPGHGHDHQGKGGRDPDCPFAPAGGLGCAASASLPATVTVMAEPEYVDALPATTTVIGSHVLRARSIFHPPKA